MLDNNVALKIPDLPILPGVKINKSLSLPGKDLRGILIKGENADFLDRNAAPLAGLVKCVYVDPPYNNLDDFLIIQILTATRNGSAKRPHIFLAFGAYFVKMEAFGFQLTIDKSII